MPRGRKSKAQLEAEAKEKEQEQGQETKSEEPTKEELAKMAAAEAKVKELEAKLQTAEEKLRKVTKKGPVLPKVMLKVPASKVSERLIKAGLKVVSISGGTLQQQKMIYFDSTVKQAKELTREVIQKVKDAEGNEREEIVRKPLLDLFDLRVLEETSKVEKTIPEESDLHKRITLGTKESRE